MKDGDIIVLIGKTEDFRQKDDGNREAIKAVLESKGRDPDGGGVSSVEDILRFFSQHKEMFKARVFLELLWEYQENQKKSMQ